MGGEKMPPHIKRNFVYRKIYNNIYEKDKEANFLIIGDTGSGKSTGCIRIGTDIDPNFSLERVCFSFTGILRLIKDGDSKGKLGPGSVIIFDEAAGSEEGADSRNALTHTNKMISFFATISRSKRLIIMYVTPFLEQLDRRIRKIGLTGILCFVGTPDRKTNRSTARIYWSVAHPMSGKVTNPHPVVKERGGQDVTYNQITIPLPRDKELIKKYKEIKDDFINGKIDDWIIELTKIKEKKDGIKIDLDPIKKYMNQHPKEFLNEKGKVDLSSILLKYPEVPDNTGRILRRYLQNQLNSVREMDNSA